MRVLMADPAAYTPPYDHALCAALARTGGVQVTLATTRFAHGEVPAPDGYERDDRAFYARGAGRSGGALGTALGAHRARRASRLVQHVPDMVRLRARAREADVVHFQWLPAAPLDARLLPGQAPVVVTAHDALGRSGPSPRAALQAADAVVVHTEAGRSALVDEGGLDPLAVHVIPHGAFTHLTAATPALPPELELAAPAEAPVALAFGLLRPYKGLDVLLDAWRAADLPPGAELWIVGAARMDVTALRARAPASVEWVERFVSDEELAGLFRRADLAVLPYTDIDQSGVLFTALAFGTPLLLSDAGGFPEVAARGAARCVPAGEVGPLAAQLGRLLREPGERGALRAAALEAAAPDGPYGWDAIARRHLVLYWALASAA